MTRDTPHLAGILCDVDNASCCERRTLYTVAGGMIKFWRTEWLVEYGNGPIGPTNNVSMPNKAQDYRTGTFVPGITIQMLFVCKCAIFEKDGLLGWRYRLVKPVSYASL